jgi:hypothetical protein
MCTAGRKWNTVPCCGTETETSLPTAGYVADRTTVYTPFPSHVCTIKEDNRDDVTSAPHPAPLQFRNSYLFLQFHSAILKRWILCHMLNGRPATSNTASWADNLMWYKCNISFAWHWPVLWPPLFLHSVRQMVSLAKNMYFFSFEGKDTATGRRAT